jgi:DNA polymerase III subunit alpha
MSEFVHLHVHSEYSMLDGAIRLKQLAKRASELGQTSIALTDHHNMHGALQFTSACKDKGLKPILGCEVNVSSGSRFENKPHQHLVLLASSQEGYLNLARAVSLGWVEGMHNGVPRIDLEVLQQCRKGLVALTGCMGGFVSQEVLLKGEEAGARALGQLKEVFEPGSLYVELQDHGFPENRPLNDVLELLAKRLELPRVATNDCHYLEKSAARAQLVLSCIASGRALADMERAHHGSHELFLKSSAEMVDPKPSRARSRSPSAAAEHATPRASPSSRASPSRRARAKPTT